MADDNNANDESIRFGTRFWDQHAGTVLSDPSIAIIEIIANAWDAGADTVEIEWPDEAGHPLVVTDNGSGMSRDELARRWSELHYDRRKELGPEVIIPKGNKGRTRKAYGQHGIGRHALFCFADRYAIKTWKDGSETSVRVTRLVGGSKPFEFSDWKIQKRDADAHGTQVSAAVGAPPVLTANTVIDLVASKFFVDPEFTVIVNGIEVPFSEVTGHGERFPVEVNGYPSVVVTRVKVETPAASKDAAQKGIAWWTNNRAVGTPTWSTHLGTLIDLRKSVARKVTYIVQADSLLEDVKADWSGYRASLRFLATERAIHEFVRSDIIAMTSDDRRERKREALAKSRHKLETLPMISQEHIAQFAEEIQIQCPNLSEKDLESAVELLGKLEASRNKYDLLSRLSQLQPDDLDGLSELLHEWSVDDAKKVLGELKLRLQLIQRLEKLVTDHKADELHELQPLFERGLWIFGPEFESIQFLSNRTLATIIREILGGGEPSTPSKRPDLVALPNASIGVYACDGYGEGHEVTHFASVVIVELKRAGVHVDDKEKNQAMGYARQLLRAGKITEATRVTAYVLGSTVDSYIAKPGKEGNIEVVPITYDVVLRRAHARTFNLLQRVSLQAPAEPDDEVLREVISSRQASLDFDAL